MPIEVVVPGALATRTGGYGYDRRMIEALRDRGRRVTVHELPGDWPWPDTAARATAADTLAALPDGRLVVIDGLAFGALPDVVRAESRRLALVALVHHPLALESGTSARDATELRRRERDALAAAARVVTTSPATARALAEDYDVPAERLATVRPGTDAAPLARRSRSDSSPKAGPADAPRRLLSVATLTRRKGHDVLLEAVATLGTRRWQLDCVGSATRDPAWAATLAERATRLGIDDRVRFAGELDDAALEACWREADLFVLATRHEGYGMVFDEALARALPIVASGAISDACAVADTVPEEAGIVVRADDAAAFGAALARWFDEPALRERLRAGARRARDGRRDWRTAGDEFAAAIDAAAAFTGADTGAEPRGSAA